MDMVLFIALSLLQLADVCTTVLIIRRGLGREANPIVAEAIDAFGLIPGLLVVKLLFVIPTWSTAMQHFSEPWMALLQKSLLAAICLGYVWVVVHNWRILRRR